MHCPTTRQGHVSLQNILRFIHTPGIFNPADILSKHWDAPSVWKILRLILFTEGDDDDIPLSRLSRLT
jgi:hypothetical protein